MILADTKFEFGERDGELLLIDECMTPDSSRYWPADKYEVGTSPPSFDKQFVRDYMDGIGWDHVPPAPRLSPEVIEQTRDRYLDAYETHHRSRLRRLVRRRLTGARLRRLVLLMRSALVRRSP